MTTEAELVAAIGDDPMAPARRVHEDWLVWARDERAPGYRAMRRLALFPHGAPGGGFFGGGGAPTTRYPRRVYPPGDWYALLGGATVRRDALWTGYPTAAAARDALARAFLELPLRRQWELLGEDGE
jgi:hypothetical protein